MYKRVNTGRHFSQSASDRGRKQAIVGSMVTGSGCECVDESEARRSGEVDIISMERGRWRLSRLLLRPTSTFLYREVADDQRSVAKSSQKRLGCCTPKAPASKSQPLQSPAGIFTKL